MRASQDRQAMLAWIVAESAIGGDNMKRHLAYLKYIVKHKWYVFLECYRAGIPWRGIIHDWHKFLPSEWFPYAYFFYNSDGSSRGVRDTTGYYKPTDTGNSAFDFAWLLHQKRARHHWQWWILPEDDGGIKILSMSDVSRREMLCDWHGAGRVWGKNNTCAWYSANKDNMQLHPDTREWIEHSLGVLTTDKRCSPGSLPSLP